MMRKPKLSDADRLILANQYEILALLKLYERQGYNEVADALRHGTESINDTYSDCPIIPLTKKTTHGLF
jgi:uncharacterized protein YfbU (UPF0304 family)